MSSYHQPHPYMVDDLFLYVIGISFIDFYLFLMEEESENENTVNTTCQL